MAQDRTDSGSAKQSEARDSMFWKWVNGHTGPNGKGRQFERE